VLISNEVAILGLVDATVNKGRQEIGSTNYVYSKKNNHVV
jgi:hypothetical protein